MGKHDCDDFKEENEEKSTFPTFSLDQCIAEYLDKENMKLTDICLERVKKLCEFSFIANPSKCSDDLLVKLFVSDIVKQQKDGYVDKTGICLLCMDRRKAYPKGYRKHLQVCLKKPESVIAYRRIITEKNNEIIASSIRKCLNMPQSDSVIDLSTKRSKQRRITEYALDSKADRILEALLFIVGTDQPLRLIDSKLFSRLLMRMNPNWRSPSHTAFSEVYVPAVAEAVKSFVKSKLKGCTVTLVLDEMKNSCGQYINFVVSTNSQTSIGNEVFFWECMQSEGSTAGAIAKKISLVANELEKAGIDCHSYATDNCNAMIATEKYTVTESGRRLSRIPCSSHALNNIFKDFVNKNPTIRETWNLVREANAIILKSPLLTNKLMEAQKTTELNELHICGLPYFFYSKDLSRDHNILLLSREDGSTNLFEDEDDLASSLAEKDPKKRKPYCLRSFFDVRWYSAWSVMQRFHLLWNALSAVNMYALEINHTNFYETFNQINVQRLGYIITLLYPFVEAINFCQRDSSRSFDGYRVIKELHEHYLRNQVFDFSNDQINDIFLSRLELFTNPSEGLNKLFSLKADHSLSLEEQSELVTMCKKEITHYTFPNLSQTEVINRLGAEVSMYINNGESRKGLSVEEFFMNYNISNIQSQFILLPQVYKIINSQVSSSAAVERSFSHQALIQTPRRHLLKQETVNNLMTIRCNFKYLERHNRDNELYDFLFRNNPIANIVKREMD